MYYCIIKQYNKLRVVSAKEQMSLTNFEWISDHDTIEDAENFLHIYMIKNIKRVLEIKDKDIAKFFGYKNKSSYYHAARRKDIEQGIINIYRLVQTKVADAEKRKENTRSDEPKSPPPK